MDFFLVKTPLCFMSLDKQGAPVCTKRDERFSHPSKLHQVSDARVPAKPGRWGRDVAMRRYGWWNDGGKDFVFCPDL